MIRFIQFAALAVALASAACSSNGERVRFPRSYGEAAALEQQSEAEFQRRVKPQVRPCAQRIDRTAERVRQALAPAPYTAANDTEARATE